MNDRLNNFKGIVYELPSAYRKVYGVPYLFGKTYRLAMDTNDTIKLGSFMYQGGDEEMKLERKRIKFTLVKNPRCDYAKKIGVKYGVERIKSA